MRGRGRRGEERSVCVCVCVCEREGEERRQPIHTNITHFQFYFHFQPSSRPLRLCPPSRSWRDPHPLPSRSGTFHLMLLYLDSPAAAPCTVAPLFSDTQCHSTRLSFPSSYASLSPSRTSHTTIKECILIYLICCFITI